MIENGRADFSDFVDLAARLTVVSRWWEETGSAIRYTAQLRGVAGAWRSETWTVHVEEIHGVDIPGYWTVGPKVRAILRDTAGRERAARDVDGGNLMATVRGMISKTSDVCFDGRPWRD